MKVAFCESYTCLFFSSPQDSGAAMVLGKLSVPGRPTDLENSRARAYRACSRCGGACLDIFHSFIFSVFFRSLSF